MKGSKALCRTILFGHRYTNCDNKKTKIEHALSQDVTICGNFGYGGGQLFENFSTKMRGGSSSNLKEANSWFSLLSPCIVFG